jgi:N-acetylmuramoyl-L-alanine amidase
MVQKKIKIIGLLLSAFMLFAPFTPAQAKDFVLVIDAGHGGHDAGAVGQSSQEKNINLRVALAVGKLIENNCPDVRVIYTRKTDVFIPLGRRAEIANEAKADLFLSIHTNSLANSKTFTGASTWTLGLAKSDANLEVAKKENGVILYENDYKTKYAGFDPNSAESYIIFEFMQDKYMKESVHFASLIQSQFRGALRPDRGVHQAGFLVLKASAMPSVLVELGFISTPVEETYLNSDEGTDVMSQSIYRAFTMFKKERDIKQTGRSMTVVPPPVKVRQVDAVPDSQNSTSQQAAQDTDDNSADDIQPAAKAPVSKPKADKPQPAKAETTSTTAANDDIIFKLQIAAVSFKLSETDARLKDLTNVEYVVENGIYKYFCGASTNYNEVYRYKKSLDTRFPDSFIVAYQGDKKIDVSQAIRQFRKNRSRN